MDFLLTSSYYWLTPHHHLSSTCNKGVTNPFFFSFQNRHTFILSICRHFKPKTNDGTSKRESSILYELTLILNVLQSVFTFVLLLFFWLVYSRVFSTFTRRKENTCTSIVIDEIPIFFIYSLLEKQTDHLATHLL